MYIGGSARYEGGEARKSDKALKRRRAFKVVRISMDDVFLSKRCKGNVQAR
jgi:hypothetical protein